MAAIEAEDAVARCLPLTLLEDCLLVERERSLRGEVLAVVDDSSVAVLRRLLDLVEVEVELPAAATCSSAAGGETARRLPRAFAEACEVADAVEVRRDLTDREKMYVSATVHCAAACAQSARLGTRASEPVL